MKSLAIILLVLIAPGTCFGAINMILPAQAPPAYNACDGSLIDDYTIPACQVDVYADTVTVSQVGGVTYFAITPCQVNVYCPVFGTRRRLAQGRVKAQGRVLAGEDKFIKWGGNRNVTLLSP